MMMMMTVMVTLRWGLQPNAGWLKVQESQMGEEEDEQQMNQQKKNFSVKRKTRERGLDVTQQK